MAAVGRFMHAPESTAAVAYTTAYNGSLKITLDLYSHAPAIAPQQRRARARISGIYILGAIASSATKLTIKGYLNETGTGLAVIPETEVALTTAITGTNGTAAYRVETDILMDTDHTLTIYAKTDAGTFTTSRLVITWEE